MNNELMHHGILGMKWGVRRYQRKDGSLTSAGKSRYSDSQRIRDEKIYGKKAAKRIEKRVASGEGVQSARHDEAVRSSSKPGKRRIAIGIAKGAVGAGLVTASALAITGKGSAGKAMNRIAKTAVVSGAGLVGKNMNIFEATAATNASLTAIGMLGLKELYSGGKDIVYGSRDIERNRSKFR